jgi:uncharacterized FlaG/YvyC family protein
MGAALTAADPAQDSLWLTRAVVAAVHKLNQPELLEHGRQLRLRKRAPGKNFMVDLVDLETGEILDELPPEAVMRMMAELETNREGEM